MASLQLSKNDEAWAALFDKHKILEEIERQGSFVIKASEINCFREARLMTKFDHRRNLPELFRQQDLAILPITRGSYIIAPFELYKSFGESDSTAPRRIGFPYYIESIDPAKITGEATAINCAYVSGILADFTGDERLMPTVSGRMGSGSFGFQVASRRGGQPLQIEVENSQLEIDGGYEGSRFLTLIEAKNSISDDFLIRQLYYPYRLWSTNISKEIKSVFLIYTNGIFTLYEYAFSDPFNYNSLTLLKEQDYILENCAISADDLAKISATAALKAEPEVAFPQADSFKRVINLAELLNEQGTLSREEITYTYDFDIRQTNYYTDAGRYLGLIAKEREEGGICYRLTEEGKRVFNLGLRARQLKFVELILSHRVFKNCFDLSLSRGKVLDKEQIVEVMRGAALYNVNSESTYRRRASTIIGWLKWIFSLKREQQPGLFEGI